MSDVKEIQVPEYSNGSMMIYESEGGDVRLDVRLENGTVWLTQQQMSLLYGKATSTINEHISDIFADDELHPEACRKKFGNSEFQQKAIAMKGHTMRPQPIFVRFVQAALERRGEHRGK